MSEVKNDIKPATRAMADTLKKHMKLNDQGIIEVSAEALASVLEGTDVTEAQFKSVQKLSTDLFSSSLLGGGEIAIAAMKKDKKLDQVSLEMPVFKHTISHSFQRSKEVPVGMPKEGEERKTEVRYGHTTSSYDVMISGSKGEAKKVRAHLANIAEEALGKK